MENDSKSQLKFGRHLMSNVLHASGLRGHDQVLVRRQLFGQELKKKH